MARYVRRRKTYKKKRYVRRRKTNFNARVKKAITSYAEKKWQDFSLNVANTGTDPAVTSTASLYNTAILQSIVAGTGIVKNRIGNKIKLRSIDLRVKSYLGALSDSNNVVRIIVLQWRDAPATLLYASQIVYDWATTTPSVNSGYNPTEAGKFRILYDKRITLSSAGTSTYNAKRIIYKLDKNIVYNFTSGATQGGEIFIFTVSDSGATPHPYCDVMMRVKYTDV